MVLNCARARRFDFDEKCTHRLDLTVRSDFSGQGDV